MVRFYDPIDRADQERIEQLLHDGGIKYYMRLAPEAALQTCQIMVAEEDVPKAEELLERSRTTH